MEFELQDIIVTTIDYRGKTPKRFDSGIPVISSANVKKGKIIPDDKYVSLEYYLKYTSKGRLEPNDILITTEAPVGEIAIVPEIGTFMISRRVFALRVNQKKADPKFIFYTLLTSGVLKYFEAISHGATAPRLYKDEILKLKLNLPKPKDQNKIASILSAYDDLIENNNQRIQLLEDMAGDIYKEWFVRFRFPDYQNTTFVDKDGKQVPHGTKGAIPEGWEKKPIKELVKNIKERYVEEKHSELGMYDLSRMPRKSLLIPRFGKSDELESSRIIFNEDDILFGSIRSYFHKVSFANKQGITNVSVLIFRARKEIYKSFALMTFFYSHFIKWSVNFSNGTKMPTISWNEVQKYPVLIPDEGLIKLFNEIVYPMLKEIHVLSDKNQVLQDTRDLLLPRLISGKLSVDNIPLSENELQMAAEASENYK